MRKTLTITIIVIVLINTLTGILTEFYPGVTAFVNSVLMMITLFFIQSASSTRIRDNYIPFIYGFLLVSMIVRFFLAFHVSFGDEADLWANNTIFIMIVLEAAVVTVPKYVMR